MLKLPQILGRRAPVRGKHERPAAGRPPLEDPALLSDIDAAIEALAVPEPVPEAEPAPAETAEAAPAAPPQEEESGQADFQAGRLCWEERNYEQALEALRRAGEKGHREAQFLCGRIYQQCLDAEGRERQALNWYRRAAKQGHLAAQLSCAAMYEEGRGTQINLKRALSWYEQAAKQGSVEAQLKCGCMYCQGRAETRNPKKARQWLETAAGSGSEEARRILRERF